MYAFYCIFNNTPTHTHTKVTAPGVLPKVIHDWDRNLGDIVLGVPVIEGVCQCEGVKLVDRLPVLVTHGLCHLIGHSHSNPKQWSEVSSMNR